MKSSSPRSFGHTRISSSSGSTLIASLLSRRPGARSQALASSTRRTPCPDHREDLVGLLLQKLFRPGLHVQSQQWFGVAGANVEPPVVELYRQPVQPVLAAARVRGRATAALGRRPLR